VKSPPSLDVVKLFVEFGYDVKAEGHKMLQWVYIVNAHHVKVDGLRDLQAFCARPGSPWLADRPRGGRQSHRRDPRRWISNAPDRSRTRLLAQGSQ
jgi:hypothetical protein